MHPHYGLLAVSTILEGAWSDEDNLNGQSKEYNEAGGVYTVAAGEGVAHNEVTRSDGVNRLIQTIVKIPKDKLTLEPQTAKASAAQLPKVDLDGGQMVIVFGTNDGVTSPASLKAMARALIARVKVNAGAKVILPLDKDFEHGFVYPESDDCKAQIGGMNFSGLMEHSKILCKVKVDGSLDFLGPGAYVFGAGQELEIANSSAEKPLELFLAAGAPLNEPWVKLLGFNGFIVAEDEATAEKVMAKVQEVGVQNFSFKSLK